MHNFPQLQRLFLAYLEQNQFQSKPHNLYAPVNYIMELGGKRARPVLLLLGYQLFDDRVARALPAAYAIELFHNFSLVHDDIMDEAPLRRGRPAVHERYGTNAGILSGDVMLIYVYQFLLQVDRPDLLPELLQTFNQTAIGVCEGQQYDVDFEQRRDVTIPEYLHMIELKTAILLAAALKIGGMVGGADADQAQHLYEFGRNIGLAFQVQDDLLDTFGDPEKFGKKVGGDIAQNKKTLLFLQAQAAANEAQRAELDQLFFGAPVEEAQKIARVTELFLACGVRESAAVLQRQYQATAFEHLAAVAVGEERKAPLIELAELLLGRES